MEPFPIRMILISMYKEMEILAITTVSYVTIVKHSLVWLKTMLSQNTFQTPLCINVLSVTKALEQIRPS